MVNDYILSINYIQKIFVKKNIYKNFENYQKILAIFSQLNCKNLNFIK